MGRITFNKGSGLGKSKYTKTEYCNEITYELLVHRLKRITSIVKNTEGFVCYVVGMGAQPKSVYAELKKEEGIKVVWNGCFLPKYLHIFRWVIASDAGLVKITDFAKLPELFLTMVEQSMAGIYFFRSSRETEFLESVIKNYSMKSQDHDFTIKGDSDYFFYIVDADNIESSTGIYEIVSYGVDASNIAKIF